MCYCFSLSLECEMYNLGWLNALKPLKHHCQALNGINKCMYKLHLIIQQMNFCKVEFSVIKVIHLPA